VAESLSGKTALVTGAAKRIGRGIALALADAGANVVVHYRSSGDEADATASDVRARGVEAWTVAADLSDRAEASQLFFRAVELARPVDLLVNSASVFDPSTLMTFTHDEFERNAQVNALAPLELARAFAAQRRHGAIVNLTDARGLSYDRGNVAYHLSKRTLASLTNMLAIELAPRIRVNAVAPGLIIPPPGRDASYVEERKAFNPLHDAGTIGHIADAVVFLMRSTFITGQTIFVDGGYHLKGRMYD
jgi:hypothetical protein